MKLIGSKYGRANGLRLQKRTNHIVIVNRIDSGIELKFDSFRQMEAELKVERKAAAVAAKKNIPYKGYKFYLYESNRV